MLVSLVREILGNVPSAGTNYDYAVLEYIVCACILLFMMALAYRMLTSIFRL